MKYRVDLSKEKVDTLIIDDISTSESERGAKEAVTTFGPLTVKHGDIIDPEKLNTFLDEWVRSETNGRISFYKKEGILIPLKDDEVVKPSKKAEVKEAKKEVKTEVKENKAVPKHSPATGNVDFDKLNFAGKIKFLKNCEDKPVLESLLKSGKMGKVLSQVAEKSLGK